MLQDAVLLFTKSQVAESDGHSKILHNLRICRSVPLDRQSLELEGFFKCCQSRPTAQKLHREIRPTDNLLYRVLLFLNLCLEQGKPFVVKEDVYFGISTIDSLLENIDQRRFLWLSPSQG